MNHGFIDGNKRVAYRLRRSCSFRPTALTSTGDQPEQWIAFIYRHLEAGTFRKDALETWLRAHTEPFDPLA